MAGLFLCPKMKLNTLGLKTPTDELKWEDVNWYRVFELPEFQMLGLCNRHVTIDNTGRDWYGMPFLEDDDCARVQGVPYVCRINDLSERELNQTLWKLETLSQREHNRFEQMFYAQYVSRRKPGEGILSAEQFFLLRTIRNVQAGNLPSPAHGRFYIVRETVDELNLRDARAEAEGHRYAPNLEKYQQLGFVSRILFVLEGQVRACRQRIWFDKLQTRHQGQLIRDKAERQLDSQRTFGALDSQREAIRLQRLSDRRAGIELPEPVAPMQINLFTFVLELEPA